MGAKSNKTILIFNPVKLSSTRVGKQTMGLAHVPLESIKANIESFLSDCSDMFKDIEEKLANCSMSHVDLSLSLAVDGSVGLFQSKVGTEVKGGITVRLSFNKPPSV